MLLLFGIGGTIGLLFAGRYVGFGHLQLVLALLGAQFATFIGLWLWVDRPIVVGTLLLAWGFLFLAPCVPLQTRVVEKAVDAPNLASTLNQAAFNVGNALGPTFGAALLSAGFGYRSLPLLGLALTTLAILLAFAAMLGSERGAVRDLTSQWIGSELGATPEAGWADVTFLALCFYGSDD